MRNTRRSILVTLIALAQLAPAATASSSPSAGEASTSSARLPYRLTILEPVGGNRFHFIGPADIDSVGRVVGTTTIDPDAMRPFRYAAGRIATLGALIGAGINEAAATGMNDRGVVVGDSQVTGAGNTGRHAFRWKAGVMTDLGTGYPAIESGSWAQDVNDAGVIIGGHYPRQEGPNRAVTWRNGRMRELPGLGGTPTSFTDLTRAVDINSAGLIAGWAVNRDNRPIAVTWSDGAIRVLPKLAGTNGDSFALAVNDRGVVAGTAQLTPHASSAVIWKNRTVRRLPQLPGETSDAQPAAINTRGDVVGTYADNDVDVTRTAVLWTPDGVIHDLNDRVQNRPAGSRLATAVAINDAGAITGRLVTAGQADRTYIITPVD